MEEPKKLYYPIGEVSKLFKVNASLLRYWEKQFPSLIKPQKNRKGNRFYTAQDIENIKAIYFLVKEQGMTLDGAKKKLKETLKIDTDPTIEAIKILNDIKYQLQEIRKSLEE